MLPEPAPPARACVHEASWCSPAHDAAKIVYGVATSSKVHKYCKRCCPPLLSLTRLGCEQVKPELVHVSQAPVGESYARLDYHEECEAGVNEQIK
jgi:hypothetical protein